MKTDQREESSAMPLYQKKWKEIFQIAHPLNRYLLTIGVCCVGWDIVAGRITVIIDPISIRIVRRNLASITIIDFSIVVVIGH